jgi:hypothetical protein
VVLGNFKNVYCGVCNAITLRFKQDIGTARAGKLTVVCICMQVRPPATACQLVSTNHADAHGGDETPPRYAAVSASPVTVVPSL